MDAFSFLNPSHTARSARTATESAIGRFMSLLFHRNTDSPQHRHAAFFSPPSGPPPALQRHSPEKQIPWRQPKP